MRHCIRLRRMGGISASLINAEIRMQNAEIVKF